MQGNWGHTDGKWPQCLCKTIKSILFTKYGQYMDICVAQLNVITTKQLIK